MKKSVILSNILMTTALSFGLQSTAMADTQANDTSPKGSVNHTQQQPTNDPAQTNSTQGMPGSSSNNTATGTTNSATPDAAPAANPSAATHDRATHTDKAGESDSAGEAVTDAWITTKVKADLATTKDLKSTDIHVETNNGVVTLTGSAPSQAEIDRAVAATKGIKGVTKVESSGLAVKAK